jgi:hypothetical protein
MIRLVTRGRFTRDYAQGLLAAPEDREPAIRKLIEGAGGKLVSFYFTTRSRRYRGVFRRRPDFYGWKVVSDGPVGNCF